MINTNEASKRLPRELKVKKNRLNATVLNVYAANMGMAKPSINDGPPTYYWDEEQFQKLKTIVQNDL